MKKNTYIYIVLASLGFIACEPEFDQPLEDTPIALQSSGEADFSKYVAIGNSLTAGFADGALFIDGQENAFANLLANQMKPAGGGDFNIPFMTDNNGGFSGLEQAFGTRLVLEIDNRGNRTPVRISETANNDITARAEGSVFNNMGVPGAKSYQLILPGFGNPAGLLTSPPSTNPYFVRFAREANSSVIGDAAIQEPTFFTLWAGNNDVLGYAVAGGAPTILEDGTIIPITNQTGSFPALDLATATQDEITAAYGNVASSYGSNDISDPALVATSTAIITSTLTANGTNNTRGVVINIPEITSIPFFTTVPFNPVPLDAATAEATNMAYTGYNDGLIGANALGALSTEELRRRTINFEAGQNPVVIFDENLTNLGAINPLLAMLPQIRQATEDDLILLTASSFIGTQAIENDPTTTNGVAIPLADKWVLTPEEQTELSTAIAGYNAGISAVAEANPSIVLYDANTRLQRLSQRGITSEGIRVTSEFGTGGTFSLDGVHLTPRGNAVIANELIEIINDEFDATLQPVQTGSFNTITIK